MKIGFDAKRAFHNFSGLGNYSRNTIQLLNKYYSKNEYYLYTPKSGEMFLDSKVKVVQPDRKFHKKFHSFWRSFYLTKQLIKDQIDLYHGLSNELPKNINKTSIRSLVTIHDLIFIRYPQLYKSIDRHIYKRKFNYACKVSDRIIAISNQTKEDIVNFFNINEDKISVVYQGCNSMYYDKVDNETKQKVRSKFKLPANYILYVGTVEKRKNLLNIIKAIHEVNINIPLVAVGRHTDYVHEIKEYIDANAVKNIILTGSVHLRDLPAIYQMADVFVYPSIFEGFGIPILEALNSQVPVITSKGSCFSEPGGESTIYIDPYNSEEIAMAIKDVLQKTELRTQMIKDGYEHAQKFKENVIADHLMNVYKSMM